MTFRLVPLDKQRLRPAVTVSDALSDLPRLEMGEGGECVTYNRDANSEYATFMRNPLGETYNHFAGVLSPQNVARLRHVKPGGSSGEIYPGSSFQKA